MTSFIPIEKVKFNKRLTKIEQRPDGISLVFADGTVAEAALLAGGDGIQSIVRAHVLQDVHPEQVLPVYAGSYCFRAVIPMAEAYEILGDLTDVAKIYFGHKRSAVTYRISGGEVSSMRPPNQREQGPRRHLCVLTLTLTLSLFFPLPLADRNSTFSSAWTIPRTGGSWRTP